MLANAEAFDPTRFFAFFTILSNLIGVAAFVWLRRATEIGRGHAASSCLRGAAAVYLTVTFFVVIFLLSGVDVQLQLVWVDVVLHKIFPIVVVLDWIVDPPRTRLSFRDGLLWLAFPLVWTGAHAGPGRHRRLVSVPVPEPGQRRVRDGGRHRRGGHHRLRADRRGDDRDRESRSRANGGHGRPRRLTGSDA